LKAIQDIPGKLQRVEHPFLGWGDRCNGVAIVKAKSGLTLDVIFAVGAGWEHVSITRGNDKEYYPPHESVIEVRELFWPDDVWVILYLPPKKQLAPFLACTHLWRPTNDEMPTPQPWML
jgi:hypothetical protein